MKAYARQRDDSELNLWVSEIHLRACQKIAELSRKLPKAPQASGGRHPTSGKPTKTEALAEAGLSTSTAQRYEGELAGSGFEEIAGDRADQIESVADAAAEKHFAEARASGKPADMKGLRNAVRTALVDTFGEPKKPPRDPGRTPEDNQYLDFILAIDQLTRVVHRDPTEIARQVAPPLREGHCRKAEDAVAKINLYITTLRGLIHVR